MPDAIASPIIGFATSVVAATLAYLLTKRREREAEWRKEKLAYYKAYIESLSGILRGDETPDGHRLYAKTTNNLLLFAPQSVIEALNAFRSENAMSNKECWSAEKHDRLLTELLLAIRRDVGVSPTDNPTTFKPKLWTSGVDKNAT